MNENQIVEASAIQSMERAQIDGQIATAKKYPMHAPGMLSQVKEAMLTFATLDEETAESMFYTLPRGGKVIQGPSIRCAEVAISCYGNLRVSTRVLETVTDGENPHVTVQAVAHDLEQNVAVCIEKRRRITKKKSKDTIDEDDINLAVNSCTAIAVRDGAFKVIPLALIKPVYLAAKRVAVGDIKSLVEKRGTVVARLKQMGATEDRILAVVDARKVEDITVEKLQVLIGLGTALKDGEITLEDAFPLIVTTEGELGTEGLKAKLGRPKGSKSKAADPTTAPSPETPAGSPASEDTAGDEKPPKKGKANPNTELGNRLLALVKAGHYIGRDEDGDPVLMEGTGPGATPDDTAMASLAVLTDKKIADLTEAEVKAIVKEIDSMTAVL